MKDLYRPVPKEHILAVGRRGLCPFHGSEGKDALFKTLAEFEQRS